MKIIYCSKKYINFCNEIIIRKQMINKQSKEQMENEKAELEKKLEELMPEKK